MTYVGATAVSGPRIFQVVSATVSLPTPLTMGVSNVNTRPTYWVPRVLTGPPSVRYWKLSVGGAP
jgi:hypothetical protein